MDDRTRRKLNEITARVPKDLARKLMRTEVDTSQEERAYDVLKSRNVSDDAKREVKRMLDKGAFRRSEVVVDEKVSKQIEDYHEKAVRQAIRNGEVSDPSHDRWAMDPRHRTKRV